MIDDITFRQCATVLCYLWQTVSPGIGTGPICDLVLKFVKYIK